MDMITKIELEDAVANYVKVSARVLEVAMVIAGIEGSFKLSGDRAYIKDTDWTFEGWRVDLSPVRDGMTHLKDISCTADFSIPWNRRPETIEFGKAEDDDKCYDDYRNEEPLTRRVQFPYEYLLTTGWEDEYKAKHAATTKRMAAFHLEQTVRAIEEAELRLDALRSKAFEYETVVYEGVK